MPYAIAGGTIARSRGRAALMLVAGLAWLSVAAAAWADTPGCVTLPRPQDEVWLVSTRSLGCGDFGAADPALQYWRLDGGRWVEGSDAFWNAKEPGHVSIFAHGNRIDYSEATEVGWAAYSAVVRQVPQQPPVRFVIWSWPSDQVPGRAVNDVLVKAARSDVDARYLAWFVNRLDGKTSVSLSGYSLGADRGGSVAFARRRQP